MTRDTRPAARGTRPRRGLTALLATLLVLGGCTVYRDDFLPAARGMVALIDATGDVIAPATLDERRLPRPWPCTGSSRDDVVQVRVRAAYRLGPDRTAAEVADAIAAHWSGAGLDPLVRLDGDRALVEARDDHDVAYDAQVRADVTPPRLVVRAVTACSHLPDGYRSFVALGDDFPALVDPDGGQPAPGAIDVDDR